MINALFGLEANTVRDIGWALVHFLWQGLALAAMLQLILPIVRSARARHHWALGTLTVMAAAPVATFVFIHGRETGSNGPEAFSLIFAHGMTNTLFTPALIPPVWLDWLVGLWLAGIAALSLRTLGGWYLAETLRRRDVVPLPSDLLQRCEALKRRLAMTCPVSFLQSRHVRVPVVVGWFRPAVVFPIAALTGLGPQYLDALILHELAHIRRLDAFTNLFLVVVETILFYHPAVWWVSRRVRIEREHCCDDDAVSICGDAAVYAEALTSLSAWRTSSALALPSNDGMLKERVARLLGIPTEPRRFSFSALTALALVCLVAAGVATATAESTSSIGQSRFAIRVVDDSVTVPDQGPLNEDRVAGSPGTLWLKREGAIEGEVVSEAHVSTGPDGKPVIDFTLTPEARDRFASLTRANIGHRLAVVVNGTVVAAPTVKEEMADGKGMISGNYTEAEGRVLASQMIGTNRPAPP